mgnify:CR=1 FL=1
MFLVYPYGILPCMEMGVRHNMDWPFSFLGNSALLGVGLAMDAFSVSLANGLNEPGMGVRRICLIAGIFALFQALMPMVGWLCVHTALQCFRAFEPFIPWIALLLLGFIGGKMIAGAIRGGEENRAAPKLGLSALLLQGLATSVDALSVGFTIASYGTFMAIGASLVIALVTFLICLGGVLIGKRFGIRLARKAGFLGGGILLFIGLRIFVQGVLLRS